MMLLFHENNKRSTKIKFFWVTGELTSQCCMLSHPPPPPHPPPAPHFYCLRYFHTPSPTSQSAPIMWREWWGLFLFACYFQQYLVISSFLRNKPSCCLFLSVIISVASISGSSLSAVYASHWSSRAADVSFKNVVVNERFDPERREKGPTGVCFINSHSALDTILPAVFTKCSKYFLLPLRPCSVD